MVVISGSFISPILFFHRWLSRGVNKSDLDTFVSNHGPLLMLSTTPPDKSIRIHHYFMLNAYKSLQVCLTLWDPMECSPPGTSVLGILQARILEWVAISFSRGSFQARDGTWVSGIAGRVFPCWATRDLLGLQILEPHLELLNQNKGDGILQSS